jgi:hypothetical protein
MPFDDEELRREALMRMAMPEMQTVSDEMTGLDDINKWRSEMNPEELQRFKDERAAEKVPPKGFLDSAAGAIYDMLPGAPGLKAGTDPLLKRKGLGR